MANQSQDKDAIVAGPTTNVHASATPAVVTAVVNPIEGQPEEDVVVPVAYLEENDSVASVIDHLQQSDEIGPQNNGSAPVDMPAFEEADNGEEDEVRSKRMKE